MAKKKSGKAIRTSSVKAAKAPVRRQSGGKQPKTKKASKVVTIILCIVLALLLAGSGVLLYFLLRDQPEDITFVVSYRNIVYKDSTSSLMLVSGEEFTITSLNGDLADYAVKIYASPKTEFALTVGGEKRAWTDYAGEDFTEGFAIEDTEKGFTISFEDLPTILSTVLEAETEITDYQGGLMFDLAVTIGESKITIPFELFTTPDALTLDVYQVTF